MVLVRDGFSWGAALFGFLWALYIGAWDAALALLAVQVAAGALLPWLLADPAQLGLAQAGVAIATGFAAGELRRALLGLRGFREHGVVHAQEREDAERRYLDAHPGVARMLLGVPA